MLKQAEAQGLRRPYLYPMPDGRIQAEWAHPDSEVSAEIDLTAHTASVSRVVVRNQASRDAVVDLTTEADISALTEFVAVFGPEGMGGKS